MWLKTADQLPEYEKLVLILLNGKTISVGELCVEQDGDRYWINMLDGWDWEYSDITHWAELPALPEEENK